MYLSTKTYDHNEGLSCAFRQWRAASHCRLIHGYALKVILTFEADSLDDRNWVQDFGGLKPIKAWLHDTFDHTLCVAEDDPEIETFRGLHALGVIDLRIVASVGCEKFAEMIFNHVHNWVQLESDSRVRLRSAEVKEHEGNSAIYTLS